MKGVQSMAINVHTSEKVYRELANSDQRLSDNMVEKVVSLQKKYQEHGEELDLMDFLGSEKIVKKKHEDAKEHLEKIIRKKKYENTIK